MKREMLMIGFLTMMLVLFGCGYKEVPAEEPPVDVAIDEPAQEAPEQTIEDIEEPQVEETIPEKEETKPVEKKTSKYSTPEPKPSSVELDTCDCSLSWDPVCGKDGKTYVNKCLFRCRGNTLDQIYQNNMCPKKTGPIDIEVDDIEQEYESVKWNGGYCWRQMYRESGIRQCENLIVNGRLDEEPEPLLGNWLGDDVISDQKSRKESYTIKAETGDVVWQSEYNADIQPLFERGEYVFSFWARNDVTSNNDWKVKLTLQDWWDQETGPIGVNGCYSVSTVIDGSRHFFEGKPNEWRHYHYTFKVPLDLEEWTSYKRESPECEYDWDMIPHGYKIEVTGPTWGHAYFDDFTLIKD